MTDRQKKFIAQWKVTQQRGKARFILYTGLAWGTAMTVFMTGYHALVVRGGSWPAIQATFFSWELPFWFGFYGVFGGPVYGWAMWWLNENRYNKLTKKR
jgi:hypothetical protein